MKYIILFYTFILFSAYHIQAQDNNEPHAVYPPHQYIINTEQNYLDNPPFVNINLSNQSYPQNEPSVRISRTNPNIIVAAWRDFRLGYVNPIRRIGYSYSTNGGMTWSVSQLLPDPNPNHISQSDPVVTSDANGYFYISSTSRKPVSGYNRDQLLYKSTNNGQTFVLYAVAIAGTGGGGEDKEWLFCDLVQGNSTYNNLMMTSTNTNNGMIRFAKSTNGGLNWSIPVNVGSGTGSNLCTGTNGFIYVVWRASGIRFDLSTNSGVSFGTDYQLSSVTFTNGFPFICVDYSTRPTRGNVYVVWDDNRNGNYDVWFQRSTNAGSNWLSSPVRINDVTTNSQFWPAIQCDTNGLLHVIYYDTRTSNSVWNSYYAYSTDAGNTWVNQRLSDTSFFGIWPNDQVRFGDYIGIDAFSTKVVPVWTDDRAGTPNQEIYTANLTGLVPAENNQTIIPTEFKLHQNFPNPFNSFTSISYSVPEVNFVSLKVFDVHGKEVGTLFEQMLKPGNYGTLFDGTNLSSGVYFYTLSSDEFAVTKKMMLIK